MAGSAEELEGFGGAIRVRATLAAIEQYRKAEGLAAISEKCFDAANIEFVLLDDGLTMDKMVSLGWHRKYIPGVHRVLRIETVAEAILNQAIIHPSLHPSIHQFKPHSHASLVANSDRQNLCFENRAFKRMFDGPSRASITASAPPWNHILMQLNLLFVVDYRTSIT